METFQVPVVDSTTGDGRDVEVEAENEREAAKIAFDETPPKTHIASSFLRKATRV